MVQPAPSPQASSLASILLVDDDSLLRKLYALLLRQQNYDVRTAGDGLEALELLEEALPDLIVSDLRMPRMSGFEFLSIVRRRFSQLPLIAISGEFLAGDDPALGIADAFFAKGCYSPAALVDKVAELLAHPPQRNPLEALPVWLPVSPRGEVFITCTMCLRSFPVPLSPATECRPREVECACCATVMRYCIDITSLPARKSHRMATFSALAKAG
jgi:CheY-like chemotaxis protein